MPAAGRSTTGSRTQQRGLADRQDSQPTALELRPSLRATWSSQASGSRRIRAASAATRIDAAARHIGPTWLDLYRRPAKLADGSVVIGRRGVPHRVDDGPRRSRSWRASSPVMPSYQGKLSGAGDRGPGRVHQVAASTRPRPTVKVTCVCALSEADSHRASPARRAVPRALPERRHHASARGCSRCDHKRDRHHVPGGHHRCLFLGGIFAHGRSGSSCLTPGPTHHGGAEPTTGCSRCTGVRHDLPVHDPGHPGRRSGTSVLPLMLGARRTSPSRSSTCSRSTCTWSARRSRSAGMIHGGADTGLDLLRAVQHAPRPRSVAPMLLGAFILGVSARSSPG